MGVVQILGIGGMTKLVEINGEFTREIKNVMRFGETKMLEINRKSAESEGDDHGQGGLPSGKVVCVHEKE